MQIDTAINSTPERDPQTTATHLHASTQRRGLLASVLGPVSTAQGLSAAGITVRQFKR